jgi:hypothetical protein
MPQESPLPVTMEMLAPAVSRCRRGTTRRSWRLPHPQAMLRRPRPQQRRPCQRLAAPAPAADLWRPLLLV